MSIWAAITLSVVATCCYQVGMVMQKVAADRMPRLGLTLRQWEVYGAFLRSPIWLGGLGITIAGLRRGVECRDIKRYLIG